MILQREVPIRCTDSSVPGTHGFLHEMIDFEWFLRHLRPTSTQLQSSRFTPGHSPWVSGSIQVFFIDSSKPICDFRFFRLPLVRNAFWDIFNHWHTKIDSILKWFFHVFDQGESKKSKITNRLRRSYKEYLYGARNSMRMFRSGTRTLQLCRGGAQMPQKSWQNLWNPIIMSRILRNPLASE